MKTKHIMVVALCFLSFQQLSAQNFIDGVKAKFKHLASTGEMLTDCPSYQGLAPKGCTQADPAGFGLHCPKTDRATGGTAENCELNIMNVIRLSLNVDARAKLDASALNTAKMHADIELRESVSHDHQTTTTEHVLKPCDTVYIKRKDFVKFKFALYNSAEVGLDITDANFKAKVEASEGFVYEYNALICGWSNHPEPRNCTFVKERRNRE